MKTQIDIYTHNNFTTYIKSVVDDFKKNNIGPQSLGEWALRLGHKSPRTFGMILNGKRNPSHDFVDTFSNYLSISKKERKYLLELAKIQKLKHQNKSVVKNLEKLKRINPHVNDFTEIKTAKFSYIAKWYHFVLKELLRGRKHFKENYHELSFLLRSKATILEIKHGINNLIKLDLVTRNEDGTLFSKDIDLMTTNDIPSEAIKVHHEGMLDLAKQAIREQGSREREFQAFTFKMDSSNMNDAKEYLREIINDFNNKFCDQNSENVYQLNMHIFSHTRNNEELQ